MIINHWPPKDGCDASCQIEPFCGDGNIDAGEQCDDGGTSTGDGCDGSCNLEGEPVPMFVTSTSSTGALGGAAGADTICQARADAATFGGTWQAVINDDSTRNLTTFLPDVPYAFLVLLQFVFVL